MTDLAAERAGGLRAPEIFLFGVSLPHVEALSSALTAQRYCVTAFLDVCSFLATARVRDPDAIVIDVAEEERHGPELIQKLCSGLCAAPVLVCGAPGDVAPTLPGCADACPVTILQTPHTPDLIVGRIRDMLTHVPGRDADPGDGADAAPSRRRNIEQGLTRRERDVLAHIIKGLSSKETARQLGISPRTVDVHRYHLLEKLGAKNVADLVRIVFEGGDPQF